MKDLTDAGWIKFKGLLFFALGVAASALLLALHFEWITAVLLAIAVWSFCRFYYFAFYVIEKYVDGRYRFSGLGSFLRYFFTGRTQSSEIQRASRGVNSTDDEPAS